MKTLKSKFVIYLIIVMMPLIWGASILSARQGPLFYLVPVKNNVFVILGDTPREVYGFNVYRKGPGEKKYKLITPSPVVPVKDPYKVQEILNGDYKWIAKKVGTEDPALLWQRLRGNRNRMLLLCLVSHRLRVAAGRTYIDKKDIMPGKTYSYKVVFINTLEKPILTKVKTVKITPPKTQASPSKVKAKAGDGAVSVTWKYPSYKGTENDLTVGFYIYRRESGSSFVKITPAPVFRIEKGLFYLDEKVVNGKKYIYGVAPVDLVGNVGKIVESNPVIPIDKTPPLVPMGLTAKDTKKGVLLLWKISPEVDFDHYDVLRAESLRGEYKKINKSPLKDPRLLDNSIVRGRPYYYKVIAVDKSGNKSKPSGAVTIVPKDLTPPGPVKEITYEVNEEKRYVTLRWHPSPEKDLLGYYIYRGTKKDRMLRINSEPLKLAKDKTYYLDKGYKSRGLRPGKHLYYGISACDESFNEGPVEIIEVDIPDNVAPHPVFNFSGEVTPEGWVRLVWQPSLSTDLEKHRVYRIKEKEKTPQVLIEVKKGTNSYIDKTADKGKQVKYYITEIDKSGNESVKSRVITLIPTDITAPGMPVNFRIIPERRRLKLMWMSPGDNDIAGYHVWYSKNGERWIKLNKKLITELSITLRNRGTAYYAVSAVDTSGNEGKKAVKKYEEVKQK